MRLMGLFLVYFSLYSGGSISPVRVFCIHKPQRRFRLGHIQDIVINVCIILIPTTLQSLPDLACNLKRGKDAL
jgi:hypothetical protein